MIMQITKNCRMSNCNILKFSKNYSKAFMVEHLFTEVFLKGALQHECIFTLNLPTRWEQSYLGTPLSFVLKMTHYC